MAKQINRNTFHKHLPPNKELTIFDVQNCLPESIPERTLRRWLANAAANDQIIKTGMKRGTRYSLVPIRHIPAFLDNYDESKRHIILKQLRDLWTHTSTALEGNTITLGDTHFILEEGLTISGKPLREHQEITGHARAIDLMYQSLTTELNEELLFNLHRSVQTDVVNDIYSPVGAWKNDVNGTYTVDKNDQQIYLEYALPKDVPFLMSKLIQYINQSKMDNLKINESIEAYAKIHAAIAHIHPFSDGNGRMARLVANIPLLKSRLPPIIIPKENRREYIQTLASYEVRVGQLTDKTGLWPEDEALNPFKSLCLNAYEETKRLLFQI